MQEELENNKEAVKISISKKDNIQWPKAKRQKDK
jgi:hypothetical protein